MQDGFRAPTGDPDGGSRILPSGHRPHTLSTRDLILFAAAAVFVIEAVGVAIVYDASLHTGFVLAVSTGGSDDYVAEFAAALVALLLSVYILCVVESRLQFQLVARWERAGGATPSPRTIRLADGLLAGAAVLFFAEAMTLTLTFAISPFNGSAILLSTNDFGEFWIEFSLVILTIPLAGCSLYAAARPLFVGLNRRALVRSATSDVRLRRWLLSRTSRIVPIAVWVRGNPLPHWRRNSGLGSVGGGVEAHLARVGATWRSRGRI